MPVVIYRKVNENRGRKRIYLDGGLLARGGVTPRQRFKLEVIEHPKAGKGLTLRFAQDGDRKVSVKRRNEKEYPVIDVSVQELAEVLNGAERIRAVIHADHIEITAHHHDRAERERTQRLAGKIARGEPLNIGSLAHGGGVLDHAVHTGLEQAGIPARLAFANEIEPRYMEASLENNPIWDERSIPVVGGMQEVEFSKLPTVEVLIAGLPCTGASLSGRAKNHLDRAEAHETAGSLFVAFLSAIQTLRPAVVLLENVPQYEHTASYTVIQSVLTSLGYQIEQTVLDGHALGSLERRDRFVMVATTQGVDFSFKGLTPVREREAQISEILDDVDAEDERWRTYDYLKAKEARDKKAGKGFRRQLLTGTEDGCGTIGRGYAKARSTEPFVQHPSDAGRSRLFTPSEHARVKTIPEQLIRGLGATVAHEILGQSVVHCAFQAVGQHLGKALRRAFAPSEPMPLAA